MTARPVPASEATPLPVSVVIPAYNREELLGRALESVARQAPTGPAEVIVVDDASTDRTAEVAEDWGATVIRLAENGGAASARNAGFQAATQRWIALLDSDDEWLPHCLETLWQLRADHVLAAGSHIAIREHEEEQRYQGPVGAEPFLLESPAPLIFPTNFLVNSATLVRRDVVLAVGGYDTSLRFSEDFDLWLRVLDRGTGIATQRVVVRYHHHGGQKTQNIFPLLDAQAAIAAAYEGRAWWSSSLTEGRRTVRAWDELRLRPRVGTRHDQLRRWSFILGRPRRIRWLAVTFWWRLRRRRRASRVSSEGQPTQAIFPGSRDHHRAAREMIGGGYIDFGGSGRSRAAMDLVRRPRGRVYAETRAEARLLRTLGQDAVPTRTRAR